SLAHPLTPSSPRAVMLHPPRRPVTPPPLQPGVQPERLAGNAQALAWFEAERQVLMAAATQALEAGFDTHAWQIPWALGRFLNLLGYWHDWTTAEQIALAATKRLGDRTAQAFALQRLGYARGRLGDYEAAHALLQQALAITRELGDRAGEADIHNALTVAYLEVGRDADALGHAEQALELFTAAGERPGQ